MSKSLLMLQQDAAATTMAIVCASPTVVSCDFPSPMTVTVGPSTFHHNPTGIWNIIGEIDCTLTNSGKEGGVCGMTAGVYDEDDLNSATTRSDNGWLDISTPAPSSETSTFSFSTGTELGSITITMAAQEVQATATSTSATGTAMGSGSTSSAGAATSGSSNPTASATARTSSNGAGQIGGVVLSSACVGSMLLLAVLW